MGWIKNIFNSGKLVESITSGVDKAFFTKEERAENFERMLKLYEPFKLAQRAIAIPYTLAFLSLHIITFIIKIIEGIKVVNYGSAELFKYNNETLGIPCSIVLGFYFGGGMIEGAIKKFKSK